MGTGKRSSLFSSDLEKRKNGKVHSCFKSSLNLALGSCMIHIGSCEQPLCGFGIGIERMKLDLILKACKQGDLVTLRDGKITIYGSYELACINLYELTEVDLRLTPVCNPIGMKRHLSQSDLFAGLQKIDFISRIGLEADQEFTHCCQLLASPAAGRTEYQKVMGYLIGRGKGLTPGGDDLLIGYGAVLRICKTEDTYERILWKLLKDQTTDISMAYFHTLFLGYANENFVRLLEQLESGSQHMTEHWIKSMEAVGHTSGYDTLLGVWLGLNRLINEKKEKGQKL